MRKDAREYEASLDDLAKFDMHILRDRLLYNVPLQKLYEAVYFDSFDIIKTLKPCDNADLGDLTVSASVFETEMLRHILSLDSKEASELSSAAPRLNKPISSRGHNSNNHMGKSKYSYGIDKHTYASR